MKTNFNKGYKMACHNDPIDYQHKQSPPHTIENTARITQKYVYTQSLFRSK